MQLLAPKEKQKERLEICFKCPSMQMSPVLGVAKCKDCGCVLRAKILAAVSDCPQGKW